MQEQRAIAKLLATAAAETNAISEALKFLRAEKKALMQQLLTGKRRLHALEPTAETAA